MKKRMPVIFIGHGSPMNALQDNAFTKTLHVVAQSMETPKAIVCISAHWQTNGTYITGSSEPEQIYDFYGFPQELYDIKYKPKGAPALAKETKRLLLGANAGLDMARGIDHGTWAVLKHLYPQCNVPVIQISLDAAKPSREHFAIGRLLSELRNEGVLIIGSGNIVHNLSMIDWAQFAKHSPGWALDFDRYVKDALNAGNDDKLIAYGDNRSAAYAVATNEHYLPMLYACALRSKGEKLEYIHEGFQHASISMRSFVIGL